jgi:hypothetical protein
MYNAKRSPSLHKGSLFYKKHFIKRTKTAFLWTNLIWRKPKRLLRPEYHYHYQKAFPVV